MALGSTSMLDHSASRPWGPGCASTLGLLETVAPLRGPRAIAACMGQCVLGAQLLKPTTPPWARAPRAEEITTATQNRGQCNRASRVAAPRISDAGNYRAAPLKEYRPAFGQLMAAIFERAWASRVPAGAATDCAREELAEVNVEIARPAGPRPARRQLREGRTVRAVGCGVGQPVLTNLARLWRHMCIRKFFRGEAVDAGPRRVRKGVVYARGRATVVGVFEVQCWVVLVYRVVDAAYYAGLSAGSNRRARSCLSRRTWACVRARQIARLYACSRVRNAWAQISYKAQPGLRPRSTRRSSTAEMPPLQSRLCVRVHCNIVDNQLVAMDEVQMRGCAPCMPSLP